jgi:hypothetical protein
MNSETVFPKENDSALTWAKFYLEVAVNNIEFLSDPLFDGNKIADGIKYGFQAEARSLRDLIRRMEKE